MVEVDTTWLDRNLRKPFTDTSVLAYSWGSRGSSPSWPSGVFQPRQANAQTTTKLDLLTDRGHLAVRPLGLDFDGFGFNEELEVAVFVRGDAHDVGELAEVLGDRAQPGERREYDVDLFFFVCSGAGGGGDATHIRHGAERFLQLRDVGGPEDLDFHVLRHRHPLVLPCLRGDVEVEHGVVVLLGELDGDLGRHGGRLERLEERLATYAHGDLVVGV